MSRASEPSARVAEILDEDREPRPLQLPSTLAQGRYVVGRQAVIGVALIVALALAMLGGRYVLAREDAAPQPVSVESSGTGVPTGAASGAGSSTGAPAKPSAGAGATPGAAAAPATQVTVHVVGEVSKPGVVTLPTGSRVDDALERAGGATSGADLSGVNLARVLVDGEQVAVPKPGASPAAAPGATPGGAAPGGATPGGAAMPPAAGAAGGAPVNLNTADLATLETLPGVGPVLAQRILDWRTEHGQFAAVEELGEVSGIGDKIYAQLSPKVTV